MACRRRRRRQVFQGKKNASEEKKRALRPGDLPPRRGRAWNPGAGPSPSGRAAAAAAMGEPATEQRVARGVGYPGPPSKALKSAKELPQKDIDAKESVAIKALEERTAHHEAERAHGKRGFQWLSLVRPRHRRR